MRVSATPSQVWYRGFCGARLTAQRSAWIADQTSLAAPILMQMGCALAGGVLSIFLLETAPAKVRQRLALAA